MHLFLLHSDLMNKNKDKKKRITVGFISLGCPKNTVDSERILAEIVEHGYIISADPDRSDVVIINTCGFILPAREESRHFLEHAVSLKSKGSVRRIILTGCWAQQASRGLLDEYPDIDAVIGLGYREQIPKVIQQLMEPGCRPILLHRPSSDANRVGHDSDRLLIGPNHRAYLRITEGCDHGCTFCTIPSIRGPLRSKPMDQVLFEANQLASAGVSELNIIGQDTASYGRDLGHSESLCSLLSQLDTIESLQWIRLLYVYPVGITPSLIETLASAERIVPYLDMPIQHASDTILKAMARPDRQEGLYQCIERLRQTIPEIVLRTTVIVGFPGETDTAFEELLTFIKTARFEALGCFPFFPEPGTAAAGFADQIPEPIKQERLDTLMRTQQEIAFAINRRRMGSILTCLVEDEDPDHGVYGRFYGQAPEIDGICLFERGERLRPGQFVDARVTDTQDYDLIVKPV